MPRSVAAKLAVTACADAGPIGGETMRLSLFSICLVLTACSGGEDPGECEAGAFNCDGTMLQECGEASAWEDKEDCADMNMMCHAEMGHCASMEETGMPMDDSGMGDN
jgi:hypothetical protein